MSGSVRKSNLWHVGTKFCGYFHVLRLMEILQGITNFYNTVQWIFRIHENFENLENSIGPKQQYKKNYFSNSTANGLKKRIENCPKLFCFNHRNQRSYFALFHHVIFDRFHFLIWSFWICHDNNRRLGNNIIKNGTFPTHIFAMENSIIRTLIQSLHVGKKAMSRTDRYTFSKYLHHPISSN